MRLISALQPGTLIFVVWNGFAGHLESRSEFLETLQALRPRVDLDCTLIVDEPWAQEAIEKAVGSLKELGWKVVENDAVVHLPTQVLVRESDERYTVYVYGVELFEGATLTSEEAKLCWDRFAQLVEPAPTPPLRRKFPEPLPSYDTSHDRPTSHLSR